MATAQQIIRQAVTKLGVLSAGQSVDGDTLQTGLNVLNTLLDLWRLDQLMAWQDTETVFNATPANATITIGPGGQIDTPVPSRIELGSYTRRGGIDTPLTPVSVPEFNGLVQKGLQSAWPEFVALERGNPLGTLRLWPLGSAELHIITRVPFHRFADLTTDYPLAAGFEYALVYSLALELSTDLGVTPTQDVRMRAVSGRRALAATSVTVPQLSIAQDSNAAEWGAMFGTVM